jgi:predicted secreted hydrolase
MTDSNLKKRRMKLQAIVSLLLIIFGCHTLPGAETEWKSALPGYHFEFVRDHASHPDYKIEWWYYTGNLTAEDGRHFGYQLTFFRVGVDFKPVNPSRWAVRDLFMTHLAVTDIDGQHFYYQDRLNRAGVGWAGALTDSYRVWNEDWEAHLDQSGNHILRAEENGIGVDFVLDAAKPPVQHGAYGVSEKGDQPGNGSHYYSITRMPTAGSLTVDGKKLKVQGLSWMDHEFGTTFLEAAVQGWDWFSIQLNDGTDLMLFQLRRKDESRDTHSSGTLVDSAGSSVPVSVNDFALQHDAPWKSQASGATYPTEWHITIRGKNLDLTLKAAVPDQELRTLQTTGAIYWEGSVNISGKHNGRDVAGRGYLEMTGYAGQPMGDLLGKQ